jgi:respiratory nitrate reductase gamma subunit
METIVDAWSFFVYVIFPYITIGVLVGGLIYRIRCWWKLPRAKAIIYPTVSGSLGTVKAVAGDILLFIKTFKGSKSLWAMAYLFHVGLALVIVGHIRTVTEVSWLWNLFNLSEAGIEDASLILGSIAGTAMFAGALFLLVRRLIPKWRLISVFQDYYLLALLLGIVVTGMSMRLFSTLEVAEIHHYARSVLTFRPESVMNNAYFLWHFFLAQALIIYFPFSKLVHIVSKPVTESWTTR